MHIKFFLLALLLPALAQANADDYPATATGALDMRSLDSPQRDHIYSCDATAMPVPIVRPWVKDGAIIDFTRKPQVSGDVNWNGEINVSNGEVLGNGLPKHTTGAFPVQNNDAAQYDRNPNRIRQQYLHVYLPPHPTIAEKPSCLNKGPIGVMLTGPALFNALDAENHDAVATELFDKCEGHPERNGIYHYHHYSPCFDSGPKDKPSPLLGFALDGFGIYGPRGANGHFITNAELDECHGVTSEVPDGKGGLVAAYHYVLNNEFPYSLGCYRGTPARMEMAPGSQVRGGPRHEAMPPHPPNLAIAAQKLGISAEELRDALGPPPPDLHEAARRLGISFEALQEALGPPPGR